MTPALTVHILSVLIVIVYGIHVPGEEVDKKTLTTLGIKTLGWQSSESTNESSNVSMYHNYSKISLQNENVASYVQNSQSQTTYAKNTNTISVKKQTGSNINSFSDSPSSQTAFTQEKDAELIGKNSHTSKNIGEDKNDLSNRNLALQNKNVESIVQDSQSQTTYAKDTNTISVKKQTGISNVNRLSLDSFPSQTAFAQERDSEMTGKSFSRISKNTDQEKDDLSNQEFWESKKKLGQTSLGQQKLTDNSNQFVSQTYQNSRTSSITSNGLQHTSKNGSNKQKLTQNTNNLALNKIIAAEKQNQKSQVFLDYDQSTSATNYHSEHIVAPPPSQPKQIYPPDYKALQYNNKEKLQHAMIAYSKCPQMATGSFVLQSSCQKFLNCWKGRGIPQNCAPGTLFNPQTLECDFASKVKCLTDSNTFRSEEYKDFSAAYTRETGIECPLEFSGVIPHKSDCSKFINCANGIKNVMDCPPGTLFSLRINSCDYPYKAECAGWSVEFGNNNVNYASQSSDVNHEGTYGGTKPSSVSQNGNDYLHADSSQWSGGNALEQDVNGDHQRSDQNVQNGYRKNQNQKSNNGESISNTQYTGAGSIDNQNVYYTGSDSFLGQGLKQNQNTQNGYYGNSEINSQHALDNQYTQNTYIKNQNQNDNYKGSSTNTQFTEAGVGHVSNQNGDYTGSGTSYQNSIYNSENLNTQHAFNSDQTAQNGYINIPNQNGNQGSQYTGSGSVTNQNDYYRQAGIYQNSAQHQNSQTSNYGVDGSNKQFINNQQTQQDYIKNQNQNTQYTGSKPIENQNGYHAGSDSSIYQNSAQKQNTQTSNYGVDSTNKHFINTQQTQQDYIKNQNQNTQYTGAKPIDNQNGYYTGSASSIYQSSAQNQNVQTGDYGGRGINNEHALSNNQNTRNDYIKNQNQNIQYTGTGSVENQNGYNAGSAFSAHQGSVQAQNSQTGYYNGREINTQHTLENNQYAQNENQAIVNENIQKTYYGLQQGSDHTPRCPHGVSGLFPHPTICAKFLNCANGQMFIQDCGPGTVFNPQTTVCDFPYNVECSDYRYIIDVRSEPKPKTPHRSSTHNTVQPSTSATAHGQYDKDDRIEGASSNVHGQYVPRENTGTYEDHQAVVTGSKDVICPNHPVGFYPHPTVCSKYFMCSNGKPIIYKCATGTVFNPLEEVCDIPKNVKCYEATNEIDYTGNANEQHNEQSGTNINLSGTSTSKQEQHSYDQNKQQNSHNHNTQSTFESNQSSSQQSSASEQKTDTNYGNQEQETEYVKTNSKFKQVCDEQDFHCSTSVCIPKSMECDGTKDCPNGIDEQNCGKFLDRFVMKDKSVLAIREKERYSNLSLTECAKGCLDSKGFKCKSFSYRNDAECFLSDSNIGLCGALIEAAPYRYYELEALTVDCTNLYKCPNNKCINHTQICDGVNDCGDRSDEKGCKAESLGYEIRLAGSNNKHEGRIELKAFGKWGYICDDRFGMRDADVVCRELGFPLGALEIKGNSYFAKEVDVSSDFLYLMDDVVCLGNETSIKDCDFNGWGVSNCEPQEIVGVVCKTPVDKCPKDQFKCDTAQECVPLAFVCDNVFDCPDQSDESPQHCEATAELRLVNGKTDREGRIEIRHHGIWGTVCDDDFNDDAAKVVCNSLGFPGKAAVKKDGFFGAGDGPIWLDQVFCRGNETAIEQCSHWYWGEHNCEHDEDVGVVCSSNSITNLVETEKKSNTDPPINLIEVPPEELLPSHCGLRKNPESYVDEIHLRVVQGSVAKKGFYPWQASLRIKNTAKPSHWCGAVVISKRFVVTAAHCLVGFSKGSYVVVAGDYNTDEEEGTEQELYIDEFYIHEEFRSGQKMNNDIALIKLKGNGFTFTKDVQPICLPEADLAYTNQLNCTISGFGSVQTGKSGYSHDLRAGWVPIQSPDVCKMPHVYGSSITDGMFCAGSLDEGVDSCDGDSGGPLACLHDGVFTLYGITSWGQHCGHANKPGVYVKVSYYRNWIETTLRKNTM